MTKKLSDFRLATEEEIEKTRKNADELIGYAIYPGFTGEVHKTVIYKIMAENFGQPNLYPSEKSNWEWVIFTDIGLLTVCDYYGDWSIGCLYTEPTDEIKAEVEVLKKCLLDKASKVHVSRQQIKKGKKGGRIISPYYLYRRTADELMGLAVRTIGEIEELEKEKKDKDSPETFLDIQNAIWNKHETVASLFRASFMSTFLSLEGFINLIYFLFIKDRYRCDMFEERIKKGEMLPIKILEMDTYCHSFKHPPLNKDDELFSAIQQFTNIRNLFMHANICAGMETPLVMHGEYPIVVKKKSEEKFGLPTDIFELTNIHIIRTYKLVEKFVAKTILAMDDNVIGGFVIAHDCIYIDFIWDKPDSIRFVFEEMEEYRWVDKHIERLKEIPTDLGKDYYETDEKEFKPKPFMDLFRIA
jgi:hypothetical protein